jgi:colicin import membrane protein
MKRCLLLFAAAAALVPGLALALDFAAERERLRTERASAQSRFVTEEKACYQRFAVHDCINEARGRRDRQLQELRRQELTLNDEERRRRAAERQREIDERNSPERRAEDERQRQQALQERRIREAEAAEKASKRQAQQQERGRKAAARPQVEEPSLPAPAAPAAPARREGGSVKTDRPTPAQAAQNRKDHEARLREAAERKASVAKKQAERKKPAASGLPTPQ